MKRHKEDILRLRSEGKTYRQIQEILGCSRGTISHHLGVGQKEKTSKRRIKQRRIVDEYIREYKESRPCMDCKQHYKYYVMDFDHVNGKSFTISGYRNYTHNLDVIKEEIAKCEVVCANCHRIRTHTRKSIKN